MLKSLKLCEIILFGLFVYLLSFPDPQWRWPIDSEHQPLVSASLNTTASTPSDTTTAIIPLLPIPPRGNITTRPCYDFSTSYIPSIFCSIWLISTLGIRLWILFASASSSTSQSLPFLGLRIYFCTWWFLYQVILMSLLRSTNPTHLSLSTICLTTILGIRIFLFLFYPPLFHSFTFIARLGNHYEHPKFDRLLSARDYCSNLCLKHRLLVLTGHLDAEELVLELDCCFSEENDDDDDDLKTIEESNSDSSTLVDMEEQKPNGTGSDQLRLSFIHP